MVQQKSWLMSRRMSQSQMRQITSQLRLTRLKSLWQKRENLVLQLTRPRQRRRSSVVPQQRSKWLSNTASREVHKKKKVKIVRHQPRMLMRKNKKLLRKRTVLARRIVAKSQMVKTSKQRVTSRRPKSRS